jgi:hypothetical protein
MLKSFRYYGSVCYSILAEKKYYGGERHGGATSIKKVLRWRETRWCHFYKKSITVARDTVPCLGPQ